MARDFVQSIMFPRETVVRGDCMLVPPQVAQLRAAGCDKVFREVASGAKTDRNQLRRALDHLAAGDVLMVTKLDRMDGNALMTISLVVMVWWLETLRAEIV